MGTRRLLRRQGRAGHGFLFAGASATPLHESRWSRGNLLSTLPIRRLDKARSAFEMEKSHQRVPPRERPAAV